MIDVLISPYWIRKCESFSLKCADTNLDRYKSRGQASIDKIISDIFTGKMGEVATYLWKKKVKKDCTKPDFKIYDRRRKSYDADLLSEGKKLHVKTQSQNSAAKYGISWILQAKKGDSDKLFKKQDESDFAVLCIIKDEKTVSILSEISIQWLFSNNLVREPAVSFFIGTKKALYWKDIEKELPHVFSKDGTGYRKRGDEKRTSERPLVLRNAS